MSPSTRETGPLYRQVVAAIEEGIHEGTWGPGDKLPSEHALCEMFGVSQITVRRALRELAHESRVFSRHGLGWFVEAEAPSAEGSGGRFDLTILVPAQDSLVHAAVSACLRAFGRAGQLVQVIYLPEGAKPDEGALPTGGAQTPLLWAVAGDETGLAARYRALTNGRGAHSLLLGRSIEGLGLRAIEIDEQAAMTEITGHLIDAGHRRIGYVGAPPELARGWRRYQGFAKRMWASGLELPLNWVLSTDVSEGLPSGRFDQAMSGNLRPTAIVCSSDVLAAQVIHRLASLGLACPSDVAVTGMGDEPFGAFLAEPLTTYRFDLDGLAEQALGAAEAVRAGKQPLLQPVTGELVVRTSCGTASRRMLSQRGGIARS